MKAETFQQNHKNYLNSKNYFLDTLSQISK